MSVPLYLIGRSPKQNGDQKGTIITLNWGTERPSIGISDGWTPHDSGSENSASFWLEHRPSKWRLVGKKYIETIEPAGWFERKCAEAGCVWFISIAKRIALGEIVPLEKIQASYCENNDGQKMPVGPWGTLFQWNLMHPK